jgi:hypothetical protein
MAVAAAPMAIGGSNSTHALMPIWPQRLRDFSLGRALRTAITTLFRARRPGGYPASLGSPLPESTLPDEPNIHDIAAISICKTAGRRHSQGILARHAIQVKRKKHPLGCVILSQGSYYEHFPIEERSIKA